MRPRLSVRVQQTNRIIEAILKSHRVRWSECGQGIARNLRNLVDVNRSATPLGQQISVGDNIEVMSPRGGVAAVTRDVNRAGQPVIGVGCPSWIGHCGQTKEPGKMVIV